MIRALIIDDEPLAHEIIKKYAGDLKTIEIVGSCSDALEAIPILNAQTIDLLFLDINMPLLSGIEFLKTMKTPPLVILTTAYTEYALQGYELNVLDYLVKPFSLSRFLVSIQKAEHQLTHHRPVDTENKIQSIFIKANKKTVQIRFNEIIYVEGLGDYIKIYTETTHFITNLSMKKMEEALPSDIFFRIHKSHIVNLQKISAIDGNMVEVCTKKLMIGHNYRADFFTRINQHTI